MTPEERADRLMAWYEGHVAGSSQALRDEVAAQIRAAEAAVERADEPK